MAISAKERQQIVSLAVAKLGKSDAEAQIIADIADRLERKYPSFRNLDKIDIVNSVSAAKTFVSSLGFKDDKGAKSFLLAIIGKDKANVTVQKAMVEEALLLLIVCVLAWIFARWILQHGVVDEIKKQIDKAKSDLAVIFAQATTS